MLLCVRIALSNLLSLQLSVMRSLYIQGRLLQKNNKNKQTNKQKIRKEKEKKRFDSLGKMHLKFRNL